MDNDVVTEPFPDMLSEQPSLVELLEMRATATVARNAADSLIGHIDALIALVIAAGGSTAT